MIVRGSGRAQHLLDVRCRLDYANVMSTDQLKQALMALPLLERVEVAQTLWQSINGDVSLNTEAEAKEAVSEALRRDNELTSGSVSGRSHEQVMEAAWQTLKCG
jgi:hypothetical protein